TGAARAQSDVIVQLSNSDDGWPYKKFYDPRKYLRPGEQGIVDRLQEAFEDLGSMGRSVARS
ncbi:MAG: hypothetical protein RQ826_13570, partial [Xanthomonadales bacterium]|nr:hypothetical protein [Xanthomonadales bacterium]